MSGQAGAARREKYYLIEYLSGIYENIAVPPGEEGTDYIGRTFREQSLPYERALAEVIPALNDYFGSLAGGTSAPLAPYDDTGQWLDGIVLEDDLPDDAYKKKPPVLRPDGAAYVRIRADIGRFFTDYVSIDVMVLSPIRKSVLNGIAVKVEQLFNEMSP